MHIGTGHTGSLPRSFALFLFFVVAPVERACKSNNHNHDHHRRSTFTCRHSWKVLANYKANFPNASARSGNIGHCYALMFAEAGHTVHLHDVDTQRLEFAVSEVQRKLLLLQACVWPVCQMYTNYMQSTSMRRSTDSVDTVLQRITTTTSLPDTVEHADFIMVRLIASRILTINCRSVFLRICH